MNGDFIWRCVKCSYHFANVTKSAGILKQEKKCPKCKFLNILTLTDKEIFIHGKPYEEPRADYYESEEPPSFPANR